MSFIHLLFYWIPFRWHITESIVFPPYAPWENPEETKIVRFPIYKKLVLLTLAGLLIWSFWNRHWKFLLILCIVPIPLHNFLVPFIKKIK